MNGLWDVCLMYDCSYVNECMLTVPKALLMSNDTVIVRSAGLFWL